MKKVPGLFFLVIAGLGCFAQQAQHRPLLSNVLIARDSFSIPPINALSMIPLLGSAYRFQQDHDILTVLALLTKSNDYKPFMRSFDYKKLYAGTEDYCDASLISNTSNEAFIIQGATDFYNEPFK